MFLLFSQTEAELTEAQDNRLTIQVITVVQYSRNSLLRPLNIWCHRLIDYTHHSFERPPQVYDQYIFAS